MFLCVCLCLTHDPMDCSLPGPSVHGILKNAGEAWLLPPSRDLPIQGLDPGLRWQVDP